MATLVVRHPDGSETEHALTGELKIGRQEGNDLLLTEGGVSRNHARVFEEGGSVFIEDLKSANGTYVDGERIEEAAPLSPQSKVVLGDYELQLKASARGGSGARKAVKPASSPGVPLGTGEARATRAMPSLQQKKAAGPAPGAAIAKRPARPVAGSTGGAPTAATGPMLRGMTGPWAGKTFNIGAKLLVGRQPPAGVVLEDDSVSRRHAELERAGTVVRVRDLGSANGTLLNGEVLGPEPIELQAGDVLQFGVVEMTFEAPEALDAPVRRGGATPSRSGRGAPEEASPGRGKLIMAVLGVVGLLVVGAVAKAALSASNGETPIERKGPSAPTDPAAQLQDLLSECRSFASNEQGAPNWVRAEETCTKALDLDPINPEGNTLIRRIKLEREASDNFAAGVKALERLKEKDALEAFKKIPKESEYFRRAKAKAKDASEQFSKRSLDDCKRYLNNSQWEVAVSRCDEFLQVWCSSQNQEELTPPLGFSLRLEGKLRRNEWRPKDALLVRFLVARAKVNPKAEPWKCNREIIFTDDDRAPDPAAEVRQWINKKYVNKFMQAAMVDYWFGRGSEALATLQKLRSNFEASQFHAETDLLVKDMGNVDQLFKVGESALTAEDPEKAAGFFREALETDTRLMANMAESHPSFYRKNILQDMATKAYSRGKHWADREDKRKACRIWKLGFEFYRGSTDLNKAVAFCSGQASQALSGAGGCSDLTVVEDYAVPGDGVAEQLAAKKTEWKCR
ncbi:FHA domain-containing protein [Corallococcus sp. H22C18031201]|uniref:FHA domain-containing protein n=1 Tax=Citreicoccus inhibens TaxID=2849499 RepID=UPI000E7676EF|nr:FHA domain-containing protein [Citreicoccus inhibens]MBU8899428.1 FHA domain-containing protein [Citreicoccus inhibens]RJS17088.1 FHA domain-containing protein [Corallococcus sp. H22C18031201]